MVKNSTIEELIKSSISDLRRTYSTIEDQLAPSGGNFAVSVSGLLPGAGSVIFSNFVNNIRPLGSKVSSCIDRLERLSREIEALENSLESWRNKYNDLRDENEELKGEYEKKENQLTSERINNTQNKTRLEQQLITAQNQNQQKDIEINRLNGILTAKETEIGQLNTQVATQNLQITQVTRERNTANEQLRLTKDQLEESRTLSNSLQIANNNKNRELEQKNEEINLLKNQARLSQEELLTEKLRFEKGNLDLFASRAGIDLEQVHSLSKYYERLFIARKTLNQVNIDLHEANIARVKQEFSQRGIDIIDIREICQKCDRIAELS